MFIENPYTSFDGHQLIATGSLQTNALAIKKALENDSHGSVLMFDNATGRTIDVDIRGTDDEIRARFPDSTVINPTFESQENAQETPETKGRGRPKLGVTPREVTLLPRHWEWLTAQPGGASVALRKLVEEARRASSDKDRQRKAQERTYHFMLAIAGDLPGFEEATRALFTNNHQKFCDLLATWPSDVRDHAMQLSAL